MTSVVEQPASSSLPLPPIRQPAGTLPLMTAEDPISLWLKLGALEKLEQAVLDGYGELLSGKTSRIPQVNKFLRQVPAFQAKINEIHKAVVEGQLRQVQHLIDRKKLAFSRDTTGATPLHKAVLHSQKDIVLYLLERYGSAIHSRDHQGRTPLHYAAVLPDSGEIYQILLEAGADDRATDVFGQKPDYYLNTPGELTIDQLLEGAVVNQIKRVKPKNHKMYRAEQRGISAKPVVNKGHIRELLTQSEVSPLEEVMLQGHGEKLIGESASDPTISEFLDKVPKILEDISELHRATSRGRLDEVQQKLKDSPSLAMARDQLGATPLHKAVLYGHPEIAKLLAEAYPATLNAKDVDGRTPLHYAAVLKDNRGMYYTLLTCGASNQIPDAKGRTPDHYVSYPDQLSLEQLIKRSQRVNAYYNANTTARQFKSKSPIAKSHSEGENLKALANGEGSESLSDEQQSVESTQTRMQHHYYQPSRRARYRSRPPLPPPRLQRLEVNSANIRKWIQDEDLEKLEGAVLQGYAEKVVKQPNEEQSEGLQQYISEEVPQLVERIRAIHSAVSKDDLAVLQQQLAKEDYALAKDHLGMTPLHRAVILGRKEALLFLIKKFPETVNARDKDGRTALHYAAAKTRKDGFNTYKVLVEAGADSSIKDQRGRSPEFYKTHHLSVPSGMSQKMRTALNHRRSQSEPPPERKQANAPPAIQEKITVALKTGDVAQLKDLTLEGWGSYLLGRTSWHEMVKLYLKTLPLFLSNVKAFHEACMTSNVEDVQNLYSGDENLMRARNQDGMMAIHIAVIYDQPEVVKFLVNTYPSALTLKDNSGKTALHLAGIRNNPEMYMLLLELGADARIFDQRGKTADYYMAVHDKSFAKSVSGRRQKSRKAGDTAEDDGSEAGSALLDAAAAAVLVGELATNSDEPEAENEAKEETTEEATTDGGATEEAAADGTTESAEGTEIETAAEETVAADVEVAAEEAEAEAAAEEAVEIEAAAEEAVEIEAAAEEAEAEATAEEAETEAAAEEAETETAAEEAVTEAAAEEAETEAAVEEGEIELAAGEAELAETNAVAEAVEMEAAAEETEAEAAAKEAEAAAEEAGAEAGAEEAGAEAGAEEAGAEAAAEEAEAEAAVEEAEAEAAAEEAEAEDAEAEAAAEEAEEEAAAEEAEAEAAAEEAEAEAAAEEAEAEAAAEEAEAEAAAEEAEAEAAAEEAEAEAAAEEAEAEAAAEEAEAEAAAEEAEMEAAAEEVEAEAAAEETEAATEEAETEAAAEVAEIEAATEEAEPEAAALVAETEAAVEVAETEAAVEAVEETSEEAVETAAEEADKEAETEGVGEAASEEAETEAAAETEVATEEAETEAATETPAEEAEAEIEAAMETAAEEAETEAAMETAAEEAESEAVAAEVVVEAANVVEEATAEGEAEETATEEAVVEADPDKAAAEEIEGEAAKEEAEGEPSTEAAGESAEETVTGVDVLEAAILEAATEATILEAAETSVEEAVSEETAKEEVSPEETGTEAGAEETTTEEPSTEEAVTDGVATDVAAEECQTEEPVIEEPIVKETVKEDDTEEIQTDAATEAVDAPEEETAVEAEPESNTEETKTEAAEEVPSEDVANEVELEGDAEIVTSAGTEETLTESTVEEAEKTETSADEVAATQEPEVNVVSDGVDSVANDNETEQVTELEGGNAGEDDKENSAENPSETTDTTAENAENDKPPSMDEVQNENDLNTEAELHSDDNKLEASDQPVETSPGETTESTENNAGEADGEETTSNTDDKQTEENTEDSEEQAIEEIEKNVEDNSEQRNASSGSDRLGELIDKWIQDRDLLRLEHVVIAGQGDRLLGRVSNDKQVSDFLQLVPTYMERIRTVHDAVVRGNLNEVRSVLTRKRFALSRDQMGASPLHLAVLHGHVDVMLYIIQQFPETLNGPDNEGRTPLHYAAVLQDGSHCYNILKNAGADSNMKDKLGLSPEHYLESPDELTVRELLQNYHLLHKQPSSVDLWQRPPTAEIMKRLTPPTEGGTITPFSNQEDSVDASSVQHQQRQQEEVDAFVSSSLATYFADDSAYVQQLREALSTGLTKLSQFRPDDPITYIATFMLQFASNHSTKKPSHVRRTSSGGRVGTPYPDGYRRSLNEQTQDVLTNGIDSTSAMSSRRTPGFMDEDLPEEEPDVLLDFEDHTKLKDEEGQTVLHLAALQRQPSEALYSTIGQTEMLIGERDGAYRTAREAAFEAGLTENAETFDRYVFDAYKEQRVSLLQLLQHEGYDRITSIPAPDGSELLAFISKTSYSGMVTLLQDCIEYQTTREEMHTLIRHGCLEAVESIVSKDHSLVTAKNARGRCSLHVAVLFGNLDIIQVLIKNNVSAVHIPDHLGRTPLHYCMAMDDVDQVGRVLIKAGALRSSRDVKMRTPSYYFVYKQEIQAILEEEQALA